MPTSCGGSSGNWRCRAMRWRLTSPPRPGASRTCWPITAGRGWRPGQRVGEARLRHGFALFFHDTHHRLVTQPEAMRAYNLSHYDGVLAFGRVLRDLYLRERLALRAFVWHEAADTVPPAEEGGTP